MTWGTITAWRTAHDGLLKATEELQQGDAADMAVEQLIKEVEDYPFCRPVGYGGLPNEEGILEIDTAYVDGDTFVIGAVAGITDIKNPISAAKALSEEKFSSFRVGVGATKYSMLYGFERKNMLTERANQWWQRRLKEIQENQLNPYDGYDTVGAIMLNQTGSMTADTPSSGLFMKKAGRVGNSPLSGSGFYVDSKIGGAAATGLGEDLMKGCLFYEIVRLMEEGCSSQQACDQAVHAFHEELTQCYGKAGVFSPVAMNKQGDWGVTTNVEFTFTVGTDMQQPEIYTVNPGKNHTTEIQPISQKWLAAYEKRVKAPIE